MFLAIVFLIIASDQYILRYDDYDRYITYNTNNNNINNNKNNINNINNTNIVVNPNIINSSISQKMYKNNSSILLLASLQPFVVRPFVLINTKAAKSSIKTINAKKCVPIIMIIVSLLNSLSTAMKI